VAPDPHREAFHHAAAGTWRDYPAYVDRLLDEAIAAREARDVADLEALYRADEAQPPAAVPTPRAASPFDHGADWCVP
jgi:hypothetical protein